MHCPASVHWVLRITGSELTINGSLGYSSAQPLNTWYCVVSFLKLLSMRVSDTAVPSFFALGIVYYLS